MPSPEQDASSTFDVSRCSSSSGLQLISRGFKIKDTEFRGEETPGAGTIFQDPGVDAGTEASRVDLSLRSRAAMTPMFKAESATAVATSRTVLSEVVFIFFVSCSSPSTILTRFLIGTSSREV